MKTHSDVIVYHDETEMNDISGHVLLFIPQNLTVKFEEDTSLFSLNTENTNSLETLYLKIKQLRNKHGFDSKFHFSSLSGSTWTKQDNAYYEALSYILDSCKKRNQQYFDKSLICKFAIIYYPSSNLRLYSGEKKERELRYAETLLRMLLKGAVHYLYDDYNTVKIQEIITDGDPHHREFDESRIIRKIQNNDPSLSGLRNYCLIHAGTNIIHLPSKHRDYPIDSKEYINSNMLQLADLILGSVNQVCHVGCGDFNCQPKIGLKVTSKKGLLANLTKEVMDKRKRGFGFKNSSHYKSFSVSEAKIIDGNWSFNQYQIKEFLDQDTIRMKFNG